MPHGNLKIHKGTIDHGANPAYTASGFEIDLSGQVGQNHRLLEVVARGHKVHQMTGAQQNEPPLILDASLAGMKLLIRAWDASGDEYGGANWANMVAQIEYTVFTSR